jgi:hypothetical protein
MKKENPNGFRSRDKELAESDKNRVVPHPTFLTVAKPAMVKPLNKLKHTQLGRSRAERDSFDKETMRSHGWKAQGTEISTEKTSVPLVGTNQPAITF